jgi:hypothetical protein
MISYDLQDRYRDRFDEPIPALAEIPEDVEDDLAALAEAALERDRPLDDEEVEPLLDLPSTDSPVGLKT